MTAVNLFSCPILTFLKFRTSVQEIKVNDNPIKSKFMGGDKVL